MWFGTDTNDLSVSLNGTVIDIFANTTQLLGVSIDKDLNFNFHIKETVRRVSRKLQVLKRYKHLIPTHAKKRLYLAYFLPHLTYCSTVWFQCGKRNADIIEKLNESILRFVFNDFNNLYGKLLQEINQPTLRARRIFRYHASKVWNLLPDVHVSSSLAAFKIALKTVHLDNECCSFSDQC